MWTDVDLAALLRRYRAAAQLTQEDLAARSGLSVQAISALERVVEEARRIVVALGDELGGAFVDCVAARAAVLDGDLDGSRRHLAAAEEVFDRRPDSMGSAMVRIARYEAALAEGRPQQARAVLAAGLDAAADPEYAHRFRRASHFPRLEHPVLNQRATRTAGF